jgi:NAD(P)-dependent dehydrogenase (short-subunit alcohol dehydrogenase family)
MVYTVKDKVILITGANRGIGKAFVDAFLEHGASKIYAGVRDVESAEMEIFGLNKRIVTIHIDLKDQDSIDQACKIATDVDVVINNAGILSHTSPFDDDVLEKLQEEIDVNVYGLLRISKAFAPILQQRNGNGIFIQMNSVASLRSKLAVSTYCASKAASFSMTQAIRSELRSKNIHVMSVHPGPIKTDMMSDAPVEIQEVAEPPSNVAQIVINALTIREGGKFDLDGDDKPNPPFLVYPDQLSSRLGNLYDHFSKLVIVEERSYG